MRRMFRLWHEADADLLSSQCSYQLLNTGQVRQSVCQSVILHSSRDASMPIQLTHPKPSLN